MRENALVCFYFQKTLEGLLDFRHMQANRRERDETKNMEFPSYNDYDSSWNWIYFGTQLNFKKHLNMFISVITIKFKH